MIIDIAIHFRLDQGGRAVILSGRGALQNMVAEGSQEEGCQQ